MDNTAVELQKLRGEIEKLTIKFDNYVKSIDLISRLVDTHEKEISRRLLVEEFEEYKLKHIEPTVGWVRDRISQEKLIIGLLSFLGASNVIMFITIFIEYVI